MKYRKQNFQCYAQKSSAYLTYIYLYHISVPADPSDRESKTYV